MGGAEVFVTYNAADLEVSLADLTIKVALLFQKKSDRGVLSSCTVTKTFK